MSRIDDLIARLCPDGVEHRALGEVGEFFSGLTGKSKADFAGGNARYLAYVNIFQNESADLGRDDFVSVGENERQTSVRRGDVLFTSSSENLDDAGMASVVLSEPSESVYLNSFCFGFRPTVTDAMLPEFSKYLFRSAHLRRQIVRTASGVTRFNISKKRFSSIRIPVPPTEVQRGIISVLDEFSELERELERELAARRRQYEHYRDALLNIDHDERDADFARLDSVAVFRRGTVMTARSVIPGNVPVVANGPQPIYFHNQSNRVGETVVVARSGAFAGAVSIWREPIFLTDAFSIHPTPGLLEPRFVFYFLQATQKALHAMKAGAGVPHVRIRDVEAYKIPIIPIGRQHRIIETLDSFDTLVNDLSIGLPAELAARRKQYEYYRDKLLTFKELAA